MLQMCSWLKSCVGLSYYLRLSLITGVSYLNLTNRICHLCLWWSWALIGAIELGGKCLFPKMRSAYLVDKTPVTYLLKEFIPFFSKKGKTNKWGIGRIRQRNCWKVGEAWATLGGQGSKTTGYKTTIWGAEWERIPHVNALETGEWSCSNVSNFEFCITA